MPSNGVQPIPGEVMRYMVTSKRRGVPAYQVDLACYRGNGRCQCIRFRAVLEPMMKSIEAQGHGPWHCEHIIRARTFFVNELIHQMLREGKVHDDSKQT